MGVISISGSTSKKGPGFVDIGGYGGSGGSSGISESWYSRLQERTMKASKKNCLNITLPHLLNILSRK
jgi:hypothetical protein